MPFKSEKQRRFLWKNEPEIARRWSKKYGSRPREKKSKPSLQDAAKKRLKNGVSR